MQVTVVIFLNAKNIKKKKTVHCPLLQNQLISRGNCHLCLTKSEEKTSRDFKIDIKLKYQGTTFSMVTPSRVPPRKRSKGFAHFYAFQGRFMFFI